jgi:hypothetical protein
MDPVSIGVAAAALLGSKAVEEFASQAGSTAWQAVQRLGVAVRSRLAPSQALDQLTAGDGGASGAVDPGGAARGGGAAGDGGEWARVVLAGEIEDAVRDDPGFRAELEALLAEAGRSKPLAGVIAVARDHAKQVNIGGDNSGSISF